jgi:hypothetical protein
VREVSSNWKGERQRERFLLIEEKKRLLLSDERERERSANCREIGRNLLIEV